MQTDASHSPQLPEGTDAESAGSDPSRSQRTRKLGQVLGLLPLVVLCLGAIATQHRTDSVPSEALETAETLETSEATVNDALPVATLRVQAVDGYAVSRSYSGELVPGRSSELGFELGGKVVDILVDEGEAVSAGQPLARLDTRSLQAQRQQLVAQRDRANAQLQELQAGPRSQNIDAARATVADLQNQVELARLQVARRQSLHDEGAISREDLDRQRFDTGALESRLQGAQSNLDELLAGTRSEQVDAQVASVRQLDAQIAAIDIDLSKSILTAPFNGRISQRLIDEGVVVSGGQALVKLVEGNSLEARIGVPTDLANTLPIGSAQQIAIGDRTIAATVAAHLPEVDPTSRTLTLVLALQTKAVIPTGQTVQLRVRETQDAEGFWLPSTALVPAERGLWSVYVAKAQGNGYAVARRDVEVVHSQGDRVLVRGTLQAGDRAIPSGTHRIVPGQAIRPIE